MSLNVTLVDYGCGNILSITRALEACGATVHLSYDPTTILKADRLVLPGVGAFGHCVNMVKERNLFEPLLDYFTKQRPVLGICVGMQMLLSQSQEYGQHLGTGFIPGKVVRIASSVDKNKRVPSVGWSKLIIKDQAAFFHALHDQWFYFVHSYVARPEQGSAIMGSYEYIDEEITALIAKEHVIGCQFHPEKSGRAGLAFFSQFLKL